MIAMLDDEKPTPRTLRDAFPPEHDDGIEGPFEQAFFSPHILWAFACIGIAALLTLAYVAWSWWSMP